jgi:hypothetical protein
MGVLSKLVIAVTGTLPADTAAIKKWVEANGGKWSARVDKRVTHLIASKEVWKKVTDSVQQASDLRIHIVSYDWLEDSLQGKRKLSEKKYTWEAIREDRKRKRQLKKFGTVADSKKFIEGCEKIKELTGSGTSKKVPSARKPKPSKGFFFTPTISTPFVSAKDDLMRRRAEREAVEAAEAAEKAAKAVKKAPFAGTVQAPIEIEDEVPDPSVASGLPTPPPSASSTKSALKKRASPISPTPSATATSVAESKAKVPSIKDLYHFYLDSTGFEYKITLARSNLYLNCIVRYQISILESHTTPHTYCTHVQYTPPPVGGVTESSDSVSDANIRNPLLNFLRNSTPQAKNAHATTTNGIPSPAEATRLRSLITPPQDLPIAPAEQARLHSLIQPAAPNPNTPFKTLICPMNSPFPTAWRAFRHVFRDLTLLSWEERFDTSKVLQKSRAKALNIEPYMYAKPALGMPVGLIPQEARLHQGEAGEAVIIGDVENGYVRNEFNLPGCDEVLGRNGIIGMAVWRDAEAVRRKEEERLEREEERIKKEKGVSKEKKRVSYNKPLFNGVMGKPTREPQGMTGAQVHAGMMRENMKFARSNGHWGYED